MIQYMQVSLIFDETVKVYIILIARTPYKENQRTIGPVSLTWALRMLKSVVIKKKKIKHSPWARADNPLVPKFLRANRKASSLWSFVASLKRISLTSDFIHIFS